MPLAAAANVGALSPGVVVGSGSPFRHTCAPFARRGYLVEPTAATVSGSGTLVAAWQADRAGVGADGIVAARSPDGRRWTSRVVPRLARCEGGRPDAVSDPWLSAGPDSVVYLITDAVTAHFQSTITVVRSLDQGTSWQPPVVLEGPGGAFSDKPTLTADPYAPGTAFATWNDIGHGRSVMFSRTLDGGGSWSRPRALTHSSLGYGPAMFPEIAVLPNGALTLVTTSDAIGQFPSDTLEHFAQISTDLGVTWSSPTAIDRLTTLPTFLRKPPAGVRADPAVFSLTSGPRGVYLASALIASPSRSRLVLSQERLDGTWTAPQTIARTNKLAVLPVVAANPAGKLAVTWDSINTVNRGAQTPATVNATVSGDNGLTWTTRRLGQPFVLPQLVPGEFFIGDYQALTSVGNDFDAIEISSRGSRRNLHTIVESFTFG